jgi:GNAT superfamily N-acetyltransferase
MSGEMGIEIRTAAPEDAAAACSVLCRSISQCCTEDHRNDRAILSAWLANKTPENVGAWFASQANFSLVALRADEVVGVAILTSDGRIVLCYVDPRVRFSGVGKELLQGLESRAREWGLHSLRLISTQTAQQFYAHNGFMAGGPAKTPFGTEGIAFSKVIDENAPKRKGCGCSSGSDSGSSST